jgi:signal transduction histidine kinase
VVRKAGGDLELNVTNTGLGIPKEEHRFVFTEFYRGIRLDGHRPTGTGLGLAITKRMVDAMGGTISMISSAAGPTTFTVHLPFVPAVARV